MDARAAATGPGEPWRILLLPQLEQICLVYRIDTFGVHQIGLYKLDEALGQLTAWLPRGPPTDPDPAVDADGMLASAEHSALVTLTHYFTQGQPRSPAPAPTWSSPAITADCTFSPGTRTARPSWCPALGKAGTSTTRSPAC